MHLLDKLAPSVESARAFNAQAERADTGGIDQMRRTYEFADRVLEVADHVAASNYDNLPVEWQGSRRSLSEFSIAIPMTAQRSVRDAGCSG
jgi:hypothetical protein